MCYFASFCMQKKEDDKRMQKKKGISLIVLVITITSTYDEANKVDTKSKNYGNPSRVLYSTGVL